MGQTVKRPNRQCQSSEGSNGPKASDRRARLLGRAAQPGKPVVILTPGLPGRTVRPSRNPGNRLQWILNHLTSYWRHYCKDESNKLKTAEIDE